MTEPLANPVGVAERVETLDVVRGVAVLGILLMNIWSFAGPQAYFDYPLGIADWPGAPVATWAVVHTLFEGSQRALFSLLFGAGMLLMVSRLQTVPGARPAATYYRRLGLLICFGLFDAFVLLWPADILITYAVCGLLLFPLRRLGIPVLVALALAVAGLHAAIRVVDLDEARELQAAYPEALTAPADDEDAQAIVAAWNRIIGRARPDLDSEKLREQIRITASGSFAEFYRERAGASVILQTVVAINAWFLDALSVMLLGMAAMRSGLLTGQWSRTALLALCIGGYAIGLPLAIAETRQMLASEFDPLVNKQWLIVYDLRRVGMAAGHLGLILLCCRAGLWPWLRKKLARVGRMPLSNYLGQSILGGLVFYTVGFGLFGQFTGWYLYGVVGLIWVLLIAWSDWWLRRFRFGPAEWLWRSLTYGRRQPLRLPVPDTTG